MRSVVILVSRIVRIPVVRIPVVRSAALRGVALRQGYGGIAVYDPAAGVAGSIVAGTAVQAGRCFDFTDEGAKSGAALEVDRKTAAPPGIFPQLECLGVGAGVCRRAYSPDDAFRIAGPEYEDIGVVRVVSAEFAGVAVFGSPPGMLVYRAVFLRSGAEGGGG